MPASADIPDHWTPLSAEIETAVLRAWPALEEIDRNGWVLRFAEGYSKRSNCVLIGPQPDKDVRSTALSRPLEAAREKAILREAASMKCVGGADCRHEISVPELEERVRDCERLYAERGMRTIFKLHGGVPAALDGLLESRGYTVADRTLFMSRDLNMEGADRTSSASGTAESAAGFAKDGLSRSVAGPSPHCASSATQTSLRCRPLGCDPWLAHWCRCSGTDLAAHDVHRRILDRIEPPTGFLALAAAANGEDADPAACAMGVADGPLLGIFDVVVAANSRRRGLGTALMHGLLEFGGKHGAGLAYLQVVRHNRAARALYDSLGFAPAGSYWYRVSPDSRLHD